MCLKLIAKSKSLQAIIWGISGMTTLIFFMKYLPSVILALK